MKSASTDGDEVFFENSRHQLTEKKLREMCTSRYEHLTVITQDIDKAYLRLFKREIPDGVKISLSRGSLSSFHFGKVHVRNYSSWFDSPLKGDYLETLLSNFNQTVSALKKMGDFRIKGTAANTAHSLWTERFNLSKRWRCPQGEEYTEQADFIRQALYGGKTFSHVKGCVYLKGHEPKKRIETLDAPAFECEHPIWRIDARSAYPSHLKRDLAYPWNGVREVFDIERRHGVASVTIRVNEHGTRCIPARVKTKDKTYTVWPEYPATLTGTYSYITLREALRHGAKIEQVHRALTFDITHKPLSRFCDNLWSTQKRVSRETNQHVSRAIKSLPRRLTGKFAVSRWRTEMVLTRDYLRAMRSDISAPMPQKVIGRHCFVRTQQGKYPAHSQLMWTIATVDRATVVLTRIEHELKKAGLPVLYVDTDSVLFSAPEGSDGQPQLPDSVKNRMGESLGQWRVDAGPLEYAFIFGPKFYALENDPHFSGVPVESQQELYDNGTCAPNHKNSIFQEAHHNGKMSLKRGTTCLN